MQSIEAIWSTDIGIDIDIDVDIDMCALTHVLLKDRQCYQYLKDIYIITTCRCAGYYEYGQSYQLSIIGCIFFTLQHFCLASCMCLVWVVHWAH